jgi:PAS domain S-box-containing protein
MASKHGKTKASLQREVDALRQQQQQQQLEAVAAAHAQAEAELLRVNRTLRMLSNCNQALVRSPSEQQLLDAVCRIAVEHGGYRMAWVGFAGNDTAKSVRPVAQAGFEEGYLASLHITWADAERGRGPTGTAIRTGRHVIARNIPTDPAFGPRRAAAIQRGYASSIALPLKDGTGPFGALMVYSAAPDAFDEAEVALLTDLAADLSFGIGALRERRARDRAEVEAAEELRSTVLLHDIGVRYVHGDALQPVIDRILDAAIALARADMGNIQLLDAEAGRLVIRAQRGFERDWLDFWATVAEGQGACGTAMQRRSQVVIEDVEQSPVFAGTPMLEVQRKAGVRAVTSTPLFDAGGDFMGMISVHFRRPHRPEERVLRRLGLLARLTADIVGHMRAEARTARLLAEVRKERDWMAALIGSSADEIWFTDTERRFTLANPAAAREFQLPANGSPVDLADLAGRLEVLRADGSPRPLEEAAPLRALAGETVRDFEEIVRTPVRNELRHRQVSSSPVRDAEGRIVGAVSVVRDITERKRAEEAAERRLREITSYYDSVPLGLAVLDTDYRFLRINALLARINGLPADAHIGRTVGEVLPTLEAQAREVGATVLRTDRPVTDIEFSGETAADPGRRRTWTESWHPLRDAAGRTTGFIVTVEDITARKEAEARLVRSLDELRQMARRLAEIDEAERKRLSRELHDRVGQSLAALAINLTCVVEGLPAETAAQVREKGREACAQAEALAADVRTVMSELRPSVLDDYGLMPAVRGYADSVARRSGLSISVDEVDEVGRLPAETETAIYRVVQEGLANVQRHSGAREVVITAEARAEGWRIVMTDDGVGFDAARPAASGAHWGLTIMRERARAVGCAVDVTSRPGAGTSVIIDVPFAPAGGQRGAGP